jgi:DNA-binding NarL/FixJ family response regulator
MSDIPTARKILEAALFAEPAMTEDGLRRAIRKALGLMWRRSPEFRAEKHYPPLSRRERSICRRLRASGVGINQIAHQLGTNVGRVSEVVNPK